MRIFIDMNHKATNDEAVYPSNFAGVDRIFALSQRPSHRGDWSLLVHALEIEKTNQAAAVKLKSAEPRHFNKT